MSGTNSIFTGSSAYSSDFQNVISRAVAIASLPVQQMTTEKSTLSSQSAELGTIDQKVAAVGSALDGVTRALDSSFVVSSSNNDALSAITGAGVTAGSYSILVSDAGAYSTMMTKTWVQAEGAAHTYHLVIGGDDYSITPADNSAAALASVINKDYGDRVQATVVNVGPTDTPDYRISLQSVGLTSDVLDIVDGASLQEQQEAGRPAQYEVNGSGITVDSGTRTISITEGLTLTINKSSATPVDVTVARSTAGVSAALAAFTSAYNALVTELGAQRGQGGGPLAGDPLVGVVSATLSGIATYSTGGAISGLRDLGLSLGSDGKLTLDTAAWSAASQANPSGVATFLHGFLDAADAPLSSLEDPVTGLVKSAKTNMQAQITAVSDRITAKQAQVDDLERRLTQQMAAADALIASMQQKYTYMSSMFQAMLANAEHG